MNVVPEFTPYERQLEDKRKYRSFFKSEKELELFLRLPLGCKQRLEYLKHCSRFVQEEKENEDGYGSDTNK